MRSLVRIGLLTILGLMTAFGLYFVSQNPPADDTYYPKCTLHSVTGLHCPGCGLTRSVYSSLHGEFAQAVAYNLLAPIVLPMMAVGLIRASWRTAFPSPRQRSLDSTKRQSSRFFRWYPLGVVVMLISYGVLRNIPVYPLTLLAPHELTP